MSLTGLIGAQVLLNEATEVSSGAVENDQEEEIDSYYATVNFENELEGRSRTDSDCPQTPSKESDNEENEEMMDVLAMRLKAASAGVVTQGTINSYERYG